MPESILFDSGVLYYNYIVMKPDFLNRLFTKGQCLCYTLF